MCVVWQDNAMSKWVVIVYSTSNPSSAILLISSNELCLLGVILMMAWLKQMGRRRVITRDCTRFSGLFPFINGWHNSQSMSNQTLKKFPRLFFNRQNNRVGSFWLSMSTRVRSRVNWVKCKTSSRCVLILALWFFFLLSFKRGLSIMYYLLKAQYYGHYMRMEREYVPSNSRTYFWMASMYLYVLWILCIV